MRSGATPPPLALPAACGAMPLKLPARNRRERKKRIKDTCPGNSDRAQCSWSCTQSVQYNIKVNPPITGWGSNTVNPL